MRNLFDYTPVPDIQRPAHGGFLQIQKNLGPISNAEFSNTELQAQRIFDEIKAAAIANPNIRIRLIYSANNEQAELIHTQNTLATWSTDVISRTLKGATGQGKLFCYLAKHIESAVQKGELTKDNVQILPFATSMFGSSDPHFIKIRKDNKLAKKYVVNGNIVTNTQLERDALAVEASVKQGCQVFSIAGSDNTYSIGGGQSDWFNTIKLVNCGGVSQGNYVQEQLKRIARYEPVMAARQFEEAIFNSMVKNEFTLVKQKTFEKSHKPVMPVIQTPDMQSYRPVLLTSAEARQNYGKVTSAQLPCLITVPADEQYESIRILSWNIMEKDVFSGFAVADKQDILQETPAAQTARYMRLSFALQDAINKNRPHFIALQGVTHRKDGFSLAQCICDNLGDDWAISEINGVMLGTVTLFNKTLFKPEKKAFYHYETKGHVAFFTSAKPVNSNSFMIFNVYPDEQNPNELFKKIHEVIKLHKVHKRIVVGDFNTHLPPVCTKKQNIITGTVCAFDAQKNQFQGATASVGALYGQVLDNTMHMCLADLEYLDPKNGAILTEQQCAPLDTSTLSRQQADEILKFRPVHTPDPRLEQKQWLPGKTRAAIQREISPIAKSYYQGTDLLADGDVFINEARNLQNEAVLAITFPRIILKTKKNDPLSHQHQLFLKIFESPEMSYFTSQTLQGMDMICIPQENLGVLFDLLQDLQKREALIKAIQQEFFTYNNAGFFTGSRTVDKTQAGLDEQSILVHINANAPLLAMVAIAKINKRYLGNKTTHIKGSYGGRLQNIQTMLVNHYPLISKITTLPLMYQAANSPKNATRLLKRIQEFLSNDVDMFNNFYSELYKFIIEIETTFRGQFEDDDLLEFILFNDELYTKETHEYPKLVQHLITYKAQKDNQDLVTFVEISALLLQLHAYQEKKSIVQLNSDRARLQSMENPADHQENLVKKKQEPSYMAFFTDLVVKLEEVLGKLCEKNPILCDLKHVLFICLKTSLELAKNCASQLQDLLNRIDICLSKKDIVGSLACIEQFINQATDQPFFEAVRQSLNQYALNISDLPSLNGLLNRSKYTKHMEQIFKDYSKINPAEAVKYIIKTQAVLTEAYIQLDAFHAGQPMYEVLGKFQQICQAWQDALDELQERIPPGKDLDFCKALHKAMSDFRIDTVDDCTNQINLASPQ